MIEKNLEIGEALGKEMVFEDLYDQYFNRIYKFVSYRVNNAEDVKDITSEIFQKILNNLCNYDPSKGKLDVWVFTIAGNTLRDYYRSKNRFKIISMDKFKDFFESEKRTEDNLEKMEEYDYLRSEIKKLPDRNRQIISYKFGAELSNSEIAELMELSVSNVGVILHRTIKTLRERMEDYYGK